MTWIVYILKQLSFGSFTNSDEYKKHPFWLLREDRKQLVFTKYILRDRMIECLVDASAISLFDDAFDYFVENPTKYDGASGDVELHKIGDYKYDIGAIIHDYPDVTNYTTSLERIKLADKAFIKVMEQLGDPDVHINKRKLVTLLAPVRFMLSRKRRQQQPTHIDNYDELLRNYVGDYKIDYTPLIKWAIILVVILILIATHPVISWLMN